MTKKLTFRLLVLRNRFIYIRQMRPILAFFLCNFHFFVISAERGAVATVDPLATDAAVRVMKKGGNAIDAAVAAGLTLGVVNGYNSGIGGGCFIVARLADGRVITINGRETAPAKAHRDLYLREGKADTQLSQLGALASGVPGALAAYARLAKAHGKLPLRVHLETAADVAEKGFAIPAAYAGRIRATAKGLKQFPASGALLLKADGLPRAAGELLRQPDLARTYRAIAKKGTGWFYGGPFARRTEVWMKTNGGILAAWDFANYKTTSPPPVRTTYRGHTILGMQPPSSGGVHVAQILNILEHFDLGKMDSGSADFFHVITEAM